MRTPRTERLVDGVLHASADKRCGFWHMMTTNEFLFNEDNISSHQEFILIRWVIRCFQRAFFDHLLEKMLATKMAFV